MRFPASLRPWASGWYALFSGRVGSFRGQVANSFATNLIGLLIALGTASLLARSLGASGRGEFAAITGWANFMGGMVVVGLPAATVYFASRSTGSARSVLATAAALASPVAAVGAGACWLLLPRLLSAHPPEVIRAAQWYVVLYSAANVVWVLPLCVLQAMQAFRVWNLSRLFQPLAWAVVLAVLAAVSSRQPAVFGVAQSVTFLVAGLPILFFAHRATTGGYKLDAGFVGPSLRYGGSVLMASLPQQANRRLDQLLMAVWVDPRSLGLYVVAVSLSNLLTVAAAPVAQVLLPRISAMSSTTEQRAELGRAIRGSVIASAAMAAGLVVVAPIAIRILFGTAFMPSLRPLLVLAPASALLCIVSAVEEALYGLGRPRDVLMAESAALVVTALGLAVTLPHLPLMGAAFTSLVSYGTTLALLARACRRAIAIPASELLVPKRSDVARLWATVLRPSEGPSHESAT